jgi:hypothetical protein
LPDDHSFGPEDIASMSAAFEAALGQLGLIERNDLATMAIAKVITANSSNAILPGAETSQQTFLTAPQHV